jgi:hypothetical protein
MQDGYSSNANDIRLLREEIAAEWWKIRPSIEHLAELLYTLNKLLSQRGKLGEFSYFLRSIDLPRSTAYNWIKRHRIAIGELTEADDLIEVETESVAAASEAEQPVQDRVEIEKLVEADNASEVAIESANVAATADALPQSQEAAICESSVTGESGEVVTGTADVTLSEPGQSAGVEIEEPVEAVNAGEVETDPAAKTPTAETSPESQEVATSNLNVMGESGEVKTDPAAETSPEPEKAVPGPADIINTDPYPDRYKLTLNTNKAERKRLETAIKRLYTIYPVDNDKDIFLTALLTDFTEEEWLEYRNGLQQISKLYGTTQYKDTVLQALRSALVEAHRARFAA